MHSGRKRKQREAGHSHSPGTPRSELSKTRHAKRKTCHRDQSITVEPFPSYPRPTPEECLSVRDELLKLHGFPEEFAKYRKQRENLNKKPLILKNCSVDKLVESEVSVADCNDSAEELSVLDGLVSIVLSQNTTDVNSQKAFKNLKAAFPNWEAVLGAKQELIESAIRCGGLAPTKASCIKNILSSLMERKGTLSLEYLRNLSIGQIKAELSSFKGIGPKTVACVLMFHLQQDDFPVDTHIFQITKTLGWVPGSADTKKTYLHLNQKIPNELKFDLNCLLFTHGKICRSCSVRGSKKEGSEKDKKPCPLLRFCCES